MMPLEYGWTGVFPATLCPFRSDESIDEQGLFQYIAELASTPGVKGVTCNGHTGEIMSLRPAERDRVTQIVAKAARAPAPDLGGRLRFADGDGRTDGNGYGNGNGHGHSN